MAERVPLRFWILTAICAMLPDIDAIGFAFSIPYSDVLGHRGLTHSIAFAVAIGLLVGGMIIGKQPELSRTALVVYFTLVTLSHSVLDAFTNGGLGVAFFAPFSNTRYFFPVRPIEVSPIGMRFFSERGLEVLASEIVWVWAPALLIYLLATAYRRAKGLKSQS